MDANIEAKLPFLPTSRWTDGGRGSEGRGLGGSPILSCTQDMCYVWNALAGVHVLQAAAPYPWSLGLSQLCRRRADWGQGGRGALDSGHQNNNLPWHWPASKQSEQTRRELSRGYIAGRAVGWSGVVVFRQEHFVKVSVLLIWWLWLDGKLLIFSLPMNAIRNYSWQAVLFRCCWKWRNFNYWLNTGLRPWYRTRVLGGPFFFVNFQLVVFCWG